MKPSARHTPRTKAAAGIALVLAVGACGQAGTPVEPSTPTVNVTLPAGTLAHVPSAPPLETLDTSFVVVQGRGGTFKVSYLKDQDDSGPSWFLRISIPGTAELVDANGRSLIAGDTLRITVQIDPTRFLASFSPHGTQFLGMQPVTLAFNYTHADLSDRDPSDLEIWYQALGDDPWAPEPSSVDVRQNMVSMTLEHFSNYAVAW